ncbi:Hypothetical Protein FCC1311_093202 [Hondaea fermentalgiana]|uniref:Uncharacterized protein n=1 Tax=Hondaea fermentalgiana TaxID=2315210 RepID=A0A2R5GQE3_9STRA|nr:Hypothetical Protein FCC1311_093202 [Hondaea fermentalgiana]|eukprot:GBG33096.1 Hypothetical Protein FCC1311_093202 [Hondaea fermentalgiana]
MATNDGKAQQRRRPERRLTRRKRHRSKETAINISELADRGAKDPEQETQKLLHIQEFVAASASDLIIPQRPSLREGIEMSGSSLRLTAARVSVVGYTEHLVRIFGAKALDKLPKTTIRRYLAVGMSHFRHLEIGNNNQRPMVGSLPMYRDENRKGYIPLGNTWIDYARVRLGDVQRRCEETVSQFSADVQNLSIELAKCKQELVRERERKRGLERVRSQYEKDINALSRELRTMTVDMREDAQRRQQMEEREGVLRSLLSELGLKQVAGIRMLFRSQRDRIAELEASMHALVQDLEWSKQSHRHMQEQCHAMEKELQEARKARWEADSKRMKVDEEREKEALAHRRSKLLCSQLRAQVAHLCAQLQVGAVSPRTADCPEPFQTRSQEVILGLHISKLFLQLNNVFLPACLELTAVFGSMSGAEFSARRRVYEGCPIVTREHRTDCTFTRRSLSLAASNLVLVSVLPLQWASPSLRPLVFLFYLLVDGFFVSGLRIVLSFDTVFVVVLKVFSKLAAVPDQARPGQSSQDPTNMKQRRARDEEEKARAQVTARTLWCVLGAILATAFITLVASVESNRKGVLGSGLADGNVLVVAMERREIENSFDSEEIAERKYRDELKEEVLEVAGEEAAADLDSYEQESSIAELEADALENYNRLVGEGPQEEPPLFTSPEEARLRKLALEELLAAGAHSTFSLFQSEVPPPKLIFSKLHKVGGTSLALALHNVTQFYNLKGGPTRGFFVSYKPGRCRHRSFDLFYQHAWRAKWMTDCLPGAAMVTIVREPVSRYISHGTWYDNRRYFIEYPDEQCDYTRSDHRKPIGGRKYVCNDDALRKNVTFATLLRRISEKPNRPKACGESCTWLTKPRSADPADAIRALDQDYHLFTTTEHLDDFMVMLALRFGWSLDTMLYEKCKDQGKVKISQRDLVGEHQWALDKINLITTEERKVYEFAKQRFEGFLAELGPGFKGIVKIFKDKLAAFHAMKKAERNGSPRWLPHPSVMMC